MLYEWVSVPYGLRTVQVIYNLPFCSRQLNQFKVGGLLWFCEKNTKLGFVIKSELLTHLKLLLSLSLT